MLVSVYGSMGDVLVEIRMFLGKYGQDKGMVDEVDEARRKRMEWKGLVGMGIGFRGGPSRIFPGYSQGGSFHLRTAGISRDESRYPYFLLSFLDPSGGLRRHFHSAR